MTSSGATAYLSGAERMLTAARLTAEGVWIRFADEREGVVPFGALDLPADALEVRVPRSDFVQLRLEGGAVEEIPWDFARHFADPDYRTRSEESASRGRSALADQLRAVRAEREITQRELAQRSGINRVTIARIESGEHLPRLRTLAALAEGLGVPLTRLLAQ